MVLWSMKLRDAGNGSADNFYSYWYYYCRVYGNWYFWVNFILWIVCLFFIGQLFDRERFMKKDHKTVVGELKKCKANISKETDKLRSIVNKYQDIIDVSDTAVMGLDSAIETLLVFESKLAQIDSALSMHIQDMHQPR